MEKVGFSTTKGNHHAINQDKYLCVPHVEQELKIKSKYPISAFGVMDGHGGEMSSDFAQQSLLKCIFTPHLIQIFERGEVSDEDIQKALIDGFLLADNECLAILEKNQDSSGTCAVLTLVYNNKLYVANLGDCRAVLAKKDGRNKWKSLALSKDHKARFKTEKTRIAKANGWLLNNRLFGVIECSRSIGDKDLKPKNLPVGADSQTNKKNNTRISGVLIAEPQIQIADIAPDCEFVIIASDGFWTHMSNKHAVDLALKLMKQTGKDKLHLVCDSLVKHAVYYGSGDDITVVIFLIEHGKAPMDVQ